MSLPLIHSAPTAADLDPLYAEAIDRLRHLVEDAARRGEREPHSAALATADARARPSVRIITIARVSEAGVAFFAHAGTGKAQQLQQNPRAALCFHWPQLQHEAIVEGEVVRLPEAEADQLWRTQPRDFGIGHWASDQTRSESPAERQGRARACRQRFEAERIPRAPGWQAFAIRPDRIDLWPTGWTRLASRVRYHRDAQGHWLVCRDNP